MAKRKGTTDPAMAGNTQGRQVAGTSYAYSRVDDRSASDFISGMSVERRKGSAKGGPEMATKVQRTPVMQERLGARYAVGVAMPGPVAPEASLTQQNTRFMKSAVNRSMPNFQLGMMG